MRDPEVGHRIDHYQLTELLAHGGMASIFKAIDSESGAAVVLKIPYLQYESDVVFFERFRREEEIGCCTNIGASQSGRARPRWCWRKAKRPPSQAVWSQAIRVAGARAAATR